MTALEIFTDYGLTTVSSGGTTAPASGTTETWTVGSSASFPAASTPYTAFHVADPQLPTETVLVTNVSGTTWSVTRGADGTTPVAHAGGFTVKNVVSKGFLGGLPQWLNVIAYGADPSGTNDSTTAISNALNAAAAGQVIYLPPGTYKISSPLAMSTQNVTLAGDGLGNTDKTGGTVLLMASGFTGTAAVSITAPGCQVQNLCIFGNSITTTSNPAANGIEIAGAKFTNLQNLFMQYINGWCVESAGGSSIANIGTSMYNLTGYNSAGGIHVKGVTGSSFAAQHSLTDCQFSQIGVSSGGNANLDALFFEDCQDILTLNTNCAVSSASTGSTLHIKGACATHLHTNIDLGVFPATSTANSVILIEDSSNGSPTQIELSCGVIQAGNVGMTVSGGANQLTVDRVWLKNNVTHGAVLSGTGFQVNFFNCTFALNGQGATGTNYDLNVPGTPTGYVRACHFLSPVTTTGTAGVQDVVNIPGGQNMPFEDCDFSGAGVVISTTFTNLPTWIRNCRGYNPHGAVAGFSIPSSGTAAAALHYDSVHYITAGTGGCTIVRNTNGFGGGTGPTITIPAAACVTVFCRAGGTLTPTYTNTPTGWVVDGQ